MSVMPRLAGAALCLALAACAAAMPGYAPPTANEKRAAQMKRVTATEGGTLTQTGTYQLSADEEKLDCKRLTGSMQIMLAHLKDARTRRSPSALSVGAQQTLAPVVGGSVKASDRDATLVRERARIEAYNRALAAKKCRTFDVEAELGEKKS
ncbi:MAG: hypothetical protein AB7K67_03595 [Hyphomicrobiaceae bacterium]|jgi:hypothetical protein